MQVRPPDSPLSDGVVSLRPWTLDDLPAVVATCSDAELQRWLPYLPSPYTEADARDYVRSTQIGWRDQRGGTFAVVDLDSGEVVGSIGMRVLDREQAVVEVGYWSAAATRRRGLTTRALRLIARWLFESVGAERVQLRADVLNTASRRVAEKAGFVLEGVLRSGGLNPREGRRIDYALYSLLPGELD
ncbi:MAG TPA: GNAT family N-acetyltransferase [Gaiellaceae bacterium]